MSAQRAKRRKKPPAKAKRKARSKAKRAPVKSKPRKPKSRSRAVDARTSERRERVRQLLGKKDSLIAKILIEEGFQVDGHDAAPSNHELQKEWKLRRQQSMRRNVANDREYWRQIAKKRAKAVRSAEDSEVERTELVWDLESDLGDFDDYLDDPDVKSTAKAMFAGERRQTRALIAKVKGLDAPTPPDPEAGKTGPKVVGLILGTSNISPEMREMLRAQGIVIDDDDAGKKDVGKK